jgi:hypothetical protein
MQCVGLTLRSLKVAFSRGPASTDRKISCNINNKQDARRSLGLPLQPELQL